MVAEFEKESELSKHDEDKSKILAMLDNRERDKEELDLESCFSELKEKMTPARGKVDFEQLASKSMADMKSESRVSIYKPEMTP